ncbi:MAG: alpha/beta hydrolase [Verrucomicrobiota bacterium]
MNPVTGESWKDRNRQILDLARQFEFKETEQGDRLNGYVFTPEGEPKDLRPAIIFFSNSLWENMNVTQFGPQALHFAERGAVTALIEYRTKTTHGTSPVEAMSDARSAIRWIRYNAEALRVDPSRVVACGGSAGAQMVLSAAMIPGVADDPNDPNISCVPDAMVLFSPIVDIISKQASFVDRFGGDLELANRCNPLKYVGKHIPPTIVFHGTADRVIPFEPVVKFVKAAKKKNNIFELCLFEGLDHSFYNFNVNPDGFDTAILETDRFLVTQGFLQDDPGATGRAEAVSGGWGW